MTTLLCCLAAVLGFALIASRTVEGSIHRDEHQFIVPGLLTMREGLMPYRDYPLFHMPYLVLLHGALGNWTGWPLLTARAVTCVAAWFTVLLLGAYAWRRLEGSTGWRLALAIGLPALLLFQPLFSYTIAHAWNHATPVLFVVLAFILHCRAALSPHRRWLLAASGACIAMAACMRLTFLPLLVPFALAIRYFPKQWPKRKFSRLVASFAWGAVAVAMPAMWLCAEAPEQFVFGNLEYPKLSNAWRKYPMSREDITRYADPITGLRESLRGEKKGLDLSRKLSKGLGRTAQANWPICAAFLLCVGAGLFVAIRDRVREFRIFFLALLLPFVAWGALAPSRFHLQYYFALLPILVLAIIESLRLLANRPRLRTAICVAVLTLTGASAWIGYGEYGFVANLRHPETWGAVSEHRWAEELRAKAGPGRMLTLNPLHAAEAGVPVYEETSSGQFGWRVAHLLPLAKRQRLHLTCPFDISVWLGADPPASLFLDADHDDAEHNAPLIEWAERKGYERVATFGPHGVWRPRSQP